MRYPTLALIGVAVSLMACSGDGGSGRENTPAPQGFVNFTRALAATVPEDTEPVDVDRLALPTPEDTEPEAS